MKRLDNYHSIMLGKMKFISTKQGIILGHQLKKGEVSND